MRRVLGAGTALLVVLAAVAFLSRVNAPEVPGPRPVRLGEEECHACRMLVSDASFAAEVVLPSGEVRVYDDPGCLLRDATADLRYAYFADAATGEWVPAAAVRFEPPGRGTPMGFGLGAVSAGRASAAALDVAQATSRVRSAGKERGGS